MMASTGNSGIGINESWVYSADLKDLDSKASKLLVPVVVFTCLLMFCGIIGNSIVCYIYLFKWKKRTIKYFIGCLASLDLITCLICMSVETAMLRHPFSLDSPALCKLLRFARAVTSISSGFLLVIIAIDRFLRICKHNKKQITVALAKRLCISAVVSGIFLSWPTLFIFGKFDREDNFIAETACSTSSEMEDTLYPVIYYGFVFLFFLTVSVSLVVFYSLIGRKLCRMPPILIKVKGTKQQQSSDSKGETSSVSLPADDQPEIVKQETKQKRNSAVSGEGTLKSSRRKSWYANSNNGSFSKSSTRRNSVIMRRKRTTLTLFLITMIQILSYVPYIALLICKAIIPGFLISLNESGQVAYNFAILSHFLSSGVNPFVYGFFSKDFRTECMKTLSSIKPFRKKIHITSPR